MAGVYYYAHLGRAWQSVRIGRSWFVRDDRGNDTGPFPTACAAREWVTAIVPA